MKSCLLIAVLWSGAATLTGAAEVTARPVKGHLSLEMRSGGGLLQIDAGEFEEVVDADGTRTLVAKRFRAAWTGRSEATHTILGDGETVENWLSRHQVSMVYNDEWEVRLASAAAVDWAEIVREAPVQVRVGGGADPLIEVQAASVLLTGGASWEVSRKANSQRIETVRKRVLREGTWVEEPGEPETTQLEPRFEVVLGAGREGQERGHDRLEGPGFVFVDEDLRVPGALNHRRLLFSGSVERVSRGDSLPGVTGGFAEVPVQIRWDLSVGEPPDVGWFGELAEAQPGGSWPSFGGHRDYVIQVTRPELVEAISVRLEDVTQHPGVAVNGGATLLDEDVAAKGQSRTTPLEFRDTDFVLSWPRTLVVPPASAEDAMPDLNLAAEDLPGFAEDGGRWVSTEVKPETRVRVRSADFGGAGKLSVRVKVEGIWEPLPAKSGGASGVLVIAPPGEGGTDADGDGLTPAEERRGVVAGGKHRRLSTERREVFLTDPHGCLGEEERIALGRRFAPWNVDLIFVEAWETEGLPVIVVEDLRRNFLPRVLRLENAEEQRKAFRAIRPRPGAGALFVEGKVDPVLFGGDLARILNLEEFGSQP